MFILSLPGISRGEQASPVEILKLDGGATDGMLPEKMGSMPPILSFPADQDGGESILKRVFFASRSDAIFDVHFKRYLHDQMTLVMHNWPVDEIFILLEGEVRVTNSATGAVHQFRGGDSFIVPLGFEGKWEQLTPLHMMTIEYGKLLSAEEHIEASKSAVDSEARN